MSGQQDLNLRLPAPKAGALTGLRYAPKIIVLKKAIKYGKKCHYQKPATFPPLRDALTGRSLSRRSRGYAL